MTFLFAFVFALAVGGNLLQAYFFLTSLILMKTLLTVRLPASVRGVVFATWHTTRLPTLTTLAGGVARGAAGSS